MAQAILLRGGVGGVTSDDVTAGKSQVLQGYKTVTTDSNDEIVEGTIPNRGNVVDTVSFENAHWESKFVARMEEGYYSQAGQWKPCVAIPYAVLANVAGIDANKMLDTLTAAGVRGTIPVRGYRGPDCTEMFMYQPDGGYVVRIEEGYYHMGGNRQWKPYVLVSPALAKSAVNYHPEKTLSDTKTCEEQGQIKMVNTQDSNFRINKSTAFGIDNWSDKSNPVFWIDFPHGNAFYHRVDNHPHTCIDAVGLGTADANSVLQWQTATSQHGVKFEGAIPRWICNTGDVISAVDNNGFAWDDTTGANRGRGIVTKIPNGHYIQGANYAFLPSPNLYPWNIREGVNINGIVGTMKDTNAGRVAFRNATFDNVLVSGVANIGLGKDLNNYSIPSTEIRDGIIRFDTRYTGLHWYAPMSTLNESVTLAHSVNLSPFKTIRLGLKFPYGGDWGAVNSMGDLVGVVWALSTNHYAEYNPYMNIKVNPNMVKKTGTSRIIPQVSKVLLDTRGLDIPTGAEYFVDVDVSDLQGHHRIVLGFAVINPSGDKVTSRTIVRATNDIFGISHIEFIN